LLNPRQSRDVVRQGRDGMSQSSSARASVPERTSVVHAPGSPIVAVIRACERIAQSDATVLITGETGTGKEVFARLVHDRSRRSQRPLVPVNCAAIPEALMESELFGHVRGAFTGAVTSRRGRVAAAEGGTLFLDEIGDLSLALQVKLLRVLQERVFEPVGSAESVPADFRLVAATNRDLAAAVEAGTFRRDLYYRLLVCPVELPPLRERQQDVAVLFEHFWNARGDQRHVDPALLRLLEEHPWPGNVRELENLVERLAVCSDGPSIGVSDLPRHFRIARAPLSAATLAAAPSPTADPAAAPAGLPTPWSRPPDFAPVPSSPLSPPPRPDASLAPFPSFDGKTIDLPTLLHRLEESFIDAALTHTCGNKKAAADLLGLQRTTLVEKLRRRTRDASVC
jgi:sigma-54 specific flagellar transcriptional regulator A